MNTVFFLRETINGENPSTSCNIPDPLTGEEDATKPLFIRVTSPANMYINKAEIKCLEVKTCRDA